MGWYLACVAIVPWLPLVAFGLGVVYRISRQATV
jgi:hypothetical protein